MRLIDVALEASLIVYAIVYGALLVCTLLYRDGPAWRMFRWMIGVGLVSAIAGGAAAHFADFDRAMAGNHPLMVSLAVVAVTRLAAALVTAMLAFHLWRSISWPRGRRRRR